MVVQIQLDQALILSEDTKAHILKEVSEKSFRDPVQQSGFVLVPFLIIQILAINTCFFLELNKLPLWLCAAIKIMLSYQYDQ